MRPLERRYQRLMFAYPSAYRQEREDEIAGTLLDVAEDGGDLDAARALVDSTEQAELFLYPGQQHLFADPSLASYDEEATSLLMRRVLDFLDR